MGLSSPYWEGLLRVSRKSRLRIEALRTERDSLGVVTRKKLNG